VVFRRSYALFFLCDCGQMFLNKISLRSLWRMGPQPSRSLRFLSKRIFRFPRTCYFRGSTSHFLQLGLSWTGTASVIQAAFDPFFLTVTQVDSSSALLCLSKSRAQLDQIDLNPPFTSYFLLPPSSPPPDVIVCAEAFPPTPLPHQMCILYFVFSDFSFLRSSGFIPEKNVLCTVVGSFSFFFFLED